MTAPTPHLPTVYLTRMATQHPGCWREVDRLRAMRGQGLPWWPPWCFLPLAGAHAILSGGGDNRLTPKSAAQIGAFGALAAWRVTQGIYEIHPAVRAAIEETPLDGAIPTDVLHRLPEWCVYVRTPGMRYAGDPAEGFFAHLESDAHTHREELRLVIDCPPLLHSQLAIHLGGTIEEGLASAIGEARRQSRGTPMSGAAMALGDATWLASAIAPLVNLVLYVCAQNAEIRDAAGKRERPANPHPRSTKSGPRIFPPDRPATWDVGFRTGAALEAAAAAGESQGGTHAGPRPHIRRAHWHHYWVGPKASQELVLRWLAPIAVNVDEGQGIVPTIRTVDGRDR